MVGSKLNPLAFGYAGAIISAVIMVLLGILGNFGFYMGAVDMMSKWHMFFSLSFGGIITGTIEAVIIGFVFAYAFGWLYTKLADL